MTGPVAALDIGTNSTRLLIVDESGRELARETAVTGLGRGLVDGQLHPDSMARTADRLRAYRSALEQFRVPVDAHHVRAIATSAARDAQNRDELFARATEALGVAPLLLSGEEEGRLAFAGATSGLAPHPDGPDLVVDIGGGSTEFIVGTPGCEPLGTVSIDAGSVRFYEAYLREFDPPGPEALSAAMTVVRAHLDDVDRLLPQARQAKRLIGLAGSVTTVAAIEIGLHTYDRNRIHHFVLTRAAVEDVFRTVATERRVDRAANPGLSADRVDTVVAGTLILATVMRFFDVDECLVSEHDILDGAVAALRSSSA